jgi:hypothetical protein
LIRQTAKKMLSSVKPRGVTNAREPAEESTCRCRKKSQESVTVSRGWSSLRDELPKFSRNVLAKIGSVNELWTLEKI